MLSPKTDDGVESGAVSRLSSEISVSRSYGSDDSVELDVFDG